jgi:uncharacterized membrane protein
MLMKPGDFLGKEKEKLVVEAIKNAERETSGEIVVHIESSCKSQVLDRAAEVFKTLDLHKTKERNGVLFYMSIKDHKFAILGDSGINAVVPDNFWETTKDLVLEEFKRGAYAEGLAKGIEMAGNHLKQYFPFHKDDQNELSDEISYGI